MKSLRRMAIGAFLLLGAAFFLSRSETTQAQGTNLLFNPGFEGEYTAYIPNPGHALYGWQVADCTPGYGGDAICGTAQMPANWWPWWISQTPSDPPWKNRMPEYKPAEAPFVNRVHGGARASQYFTFHSTHTAGHVQVVPVPANANLRFSIWGQAWSDAEDSGASIFPTPMNMKIGIDPTGGTDPYSPNIVWSGSTSVYDAYALFTVEARAQGSSVSVWTFSSPDEARKHNDVYWDDATLEVIGSAPPASSGNSGGGTTGGNTAPAPVAAPSGPTPTPNANGDIIHIVGAGDTLWSIAARAGLTLDELLALNEGLTRDSFINAGDEIIIGSGEPGEPEATAPETTDATPEGEGEEGGEPETTPEPTQAPEPTEPAPTEVPAGGSICIKAFDDANENGLHDAGESLQGGVAFTVTNGETVVSNYITTGDETEPFCIEGLESGTYRVSRSKLENEILTTPGDWAVSVANGQSQDLVFGSYETEAAEVAELPAE
ncbi:MAG: LysM peptidoglycan-binding domain-containing protein, partial [Anaerolineales bacterium]|nr:LysM peptidoglycan-binding domain-containing protein [Anaerolineales bacterium]